MALVDPSRKIQALTRGDLQHPACCACCGSSDPERTFITFGIYYDYEGNVYICSLCFREAVMVMEFFTPEEVEKQLADANKLLIENAALKEELDNARPILNSVRSMFTNVNPDGSVSDSVHPLIAETVDSGAEEQSEVAELSDSEGPTDTSGSKPRDRRKPVIH